MKFLDIVPSWLWGLLLAVALAALGVERLEVLKARADVASARKALSDERLDRQAENTKRAVAALEDLQRVLALQATHAITQQENLSAYEKKLAVLDDRRRAAFSNAERMRKQFAQLAALDRNEAASDSAACQRVADRSAVVAVMAERGRDLLERGRLVVEQRDAEVTLLLSIVSNDRKLLGSQPAAQ